MTMVCLHVPRATIVPQFRVVLRARVERRGVCLYKGEGVMRLPSTILELLSQADESKAALEAPGRRPLSYGGLRAHVVETVERLNSLGIGRDDPVAPPGPAGAEAVALVLHPSGTTSRPKIVPLTHQNVCASALSVAESLSLLSSDRCLNVMPLFHIHGLIAAVLASLSAGASVCCTPGFNALKFFAWIDAARAAWDTAGP